MRTLAAALLVVLACAAVAADDQPDPVPFRMRTWFFEDVRDLLIPGDSVYAIASRGATADPVFSQEKFETALEELAAVDFAGIHKTIVLSTYEDLQLVIADLLEDITAIAYNTERGMTPMDELTHLDEWVPKFAELCHEHGREMTWGPTHHMLTRNPDLFQLAAHCDGMGLQHQRPLQNDGLEAFAALTRERAELIHGINAACAVTVQVVLERTPAEEAIPALASVADCVDVLGAWTMRDRAGLRELLEGLRPFRQDRLP
jgi:hypothetical protein